MLILIISMLLQQVYTTKQTLKTPTLKSRCFHVVIIIVTPIKFIIVKIIIIGMIGTVSIMSVIPLNLS